MYSITGDDVKGIVRDCSDQVDVGCTTSHVRSIEIKQCFCKTDNCNDASDTSNGSESIVSSTFNVIVVAVAVIVSAILI